jgi:hypothetical protein
MNYVNEGLLFQQRQNFVLTKKGKLFADRIAAEMFVISSQGH